MKLTLALAQVGATANSEENLATANEYAQRAAEGGADLLVFPEVFMNHYPPATPQEAMEAQTLDGRFVTGMRGLAQRLNMWIVFGMRERGDAADGRSFNTSVILNSAGHVVGVYRKTHLYDAFGAQESARVVPGDALFQPVDTPWGRIGMFVCYELRFPEIARDQVAKGADILIVPSGWVRGPMKEYHWQTLVTARALENTAFVVACDQVSDYYCGCSLVVDPMGITVAQAGETPALVLTTIDTDRIAEVRQKLPSFRHRRPELYQSIVST